MSETALIAKLNPIASGIAHEDETARVLSDAGDAPSEAPTEAPVV